MPAPPIHCTPCRIRFKDRWYRIYEDGSVSTALDLKQLSYLSFSAKMQALEQERSLPRLSPRDPEARTIRREASRLRRNRNARDRAQAMRDLGMTRTTSGQWE